MHIYIYIYIYLATWGGFDWVTPITKSGTNFSVRKTNSALWVKIISRIGSLNLFKADQKNMYHIYLEPK